MVTRLSAEFDFEQWFERELKGTVGLGRGTHSIVSAIIIVIMPAPNRRGH